MTAYLQSKNTLLEEPKTWLITGVAGFIGSNLLEVLLTLNQKVIGMDNFATGYEKNLLEVKSIVSKEQWLNFKFIEGSINNIVDCRKACDGAQYVLHQAALGSVPRSIENPIDTNETNISGFLNMLVAARDSRVNRFVYAASSSTYGDHPGLPKIEEKIGNPISPYAVTKLVNELYAAVFAKTYGLETIGLRYFNVFGKRQDPNGAYAAVIPKWIAVMLKGEAININGDGETSRDFCYIDNVVQANILAATCKNRDAINQIYNIAVGGRTTLNDLYRQLLQNILFIQPNLNIAKPVYQNFRSGDVRHSLADISKASKLLDYYPLYEVNEGLKLAMDWYIKKSRE